MSAIVAALARHSAADPGRCALTDGMVSIDYRSLHRHVVTLAGGLRSGGARIVALALPNGPAWMIADLAALAARLPCVPLPPFFSLAQLEHLVAEAGVDTILTDAHGALDVKHTAFYETLVNRLDDAEDRAALIHAARVFYRLYGGIFETLDRRRAARAEHAAATSRPAREQAAA